MLAQNLHQEVTFCGYLMITDCLPIDFSYLKQFERVIFRMIWTEENQRITLIIQHQIYYSVRQNPAI